MSISTFWYCLKQGIKNIIRNIWFSLASTATIAACIFLFCLFFSIISNVQYMVRHIETTVGVTVLFDEDVPEEEILALKEKLEAREEIKQVLYTSAQEAWDSFKEEYFAGNEELAEGFAEDNPLTGSESLCIYLHDIDRQEELAASLKAMDGVRQV